VLKRLLIFVFLVLNRVLVAQQDEKILHNPPVPGFEVYDLCWGSQTLFKNLSAAAQTYTWTIFDKDTAGAFTNILYSDHSVDLGYRFGHKGDYVVRLVADNGHTVAMTQTITVDTITKASFGYQNCQGRFLNLSRCADSFVWNFGDSSGKGSTDHSPVYFYADYKYFYPWMIASRQTKTDSVRNQVWGIPNFLNGKFSYVLRNDTAYFTAADSTGWSYLDYYWTWGDATKTLISGPTGRKVWHYYPKQDDDVNYIVYLLVRDVCNQNYSYASFNIEGTHPVYGTNIFPNPLDETSVIHVLSDRKDELQDVRIIDVFGNRVMNYTVWEKDKGLDLDLSLLPKGIYLLELNFNGDIVRSKIVRNE
jgi:hypothetical protein